MSLNSVFVLPETDRGNVLAVAACLITSNNDAVVSRDNCVEASWDAGNDCVSCLDLPCGIPNRKIKRNYFSFRMCVCILHTVHS